ncbi:hypothetical protein HDU97_002494 [Phlyctochytrium planicorne]|nr:hypothetical protein HDU97_002494 [Phlyctochytrium planicorne]
MTTDLPTYSNDNSVASVEAACQDINKNWKNLSDSFDEFKKTQGAIEKANANYERATAIRSEVASLNKKVIVLNRTKKEAELVKQVDAAILDGELAWANITSHQSTFNSTHRPNLNKLDTDLTTIFGTFTKLPIASNEKEALKDNADLIRAAQRIRLAASNLPNHIRAEGLLSEALEKAKSMRQRLIEEYSGDGFENNPLPNTMSASAESFIDPETQLAAVGIGKELDEKISTAFAVDTTLPPHVQKVAITLDPNNPGSRRRNAIVIQNAVYRLDDKVMNLEDSLAYLSTVISQCKVELKQNVSLVQEVGLKVYSRGVEYAKSANPSFVGLDTTVVAKLPELLASGVVLSSL